MSPSTAITFAVLFVKVFCCLCESPTDFDFHMLKRIDTKIAIMKRLGLKLALPSASRQSDLLLRRYAAPKFMMGLFKEVNNAESRGDGIQMNTTDEHYKIERKYLEETHVDTVISFFKYDHDKSWKTNHTDVKLKFITKLKSQEDKVEGAELKIFKRLPRNSSMIHGNCTVSIYLILPEEATPQLLDTRDVHAWTSGWQTFNVTNALKLWSLFPLTNHGLRIVVHHAHETLNSHGFGIVGSRGNLEKRPYLVGFVKTAPRLFPTFTPELPTTRERRGTEKTDWRKRDWRKRNRKSGKECKLKKILVDFKSIGLHGVIIAPHSYDMFFCQGTCFTPIDAALQATNHAILQAMLHVVDPKIPSPCCSPDDLKSMTILFRDDNDSIVLKQHRKMIVKSCKCT